MDFEIDIEIVDRGVKRKILKFEPDLVGISSVSQNFNIAKDISSFCKEQDIPVVVGGPHIASLPSSLGSSMDVGVIGEGEQTILELLKYVKEYGMDLSKIEQIDGIVYRYDGEVKITKMRKLIDPLDQLPLPARDLLNVGNRDIVSMFSSRGCPYRCRFCSSSRFWGSVRYFSANYVVNEIEEIVDEYRPLHIIFSDDLFIGDRKRLRKIANLISEEKIDEKVSFSLKCRANLVNEELVRLLKQMNVIEIGIGFESGSQKTLSYLKDGVTVQQNKMAADIIKKFDILLSPTFIIGSPYETREDMLETLNFIRKSKIDQFNFFALTPLPGTPIWDYALGRGLVSNDMDWSKLSLNPNSLGEVSLSEKLSRKELFELFSIFERERKKRYLKYLVKKGNKYRRLILPFLRKKMDYMRYRLLRAW